MAVESNPITGHGDADFEIAAWIKAKDLFKQNRKAQHKSSDTPELLEAFLLTSWSPQEAKAFCLEQQKIADLEYSPNLEGILSRIDMFMKAGDQAVNSAPESIGLAWTGIRLCLHTIQDDFATFRLFSGACSDMVGILTSCSAYGRMFGQEEGPPFMQETRSQVVDMIPGIYADLLDFSYSMHKHSRERKIRRFVSSLFRSLQSKYADKLASLASNQQKMSQYAHTASEQLTKYYLERGTHDQCHMLEDLSTIESAVQASNEQHSVLVEALRLQNDQMKMMLKKTPMEIAIENFEINYNALKMSVDPKKVHEANLTRREAGTCLWILEVDEFKAWRQSDENAILWVSGGGGFGKSTLMSSVIETLENQSASHNAMVHYFFFKKGDDATQESERMARSLLSQLYSLFRTSTDLELANTIVASLTSAGTEGSRRLADSSKRLLPLIEAYQALARLLKKPIYLFIDALDECVDRKEHDLLQKLCQITTSNNKIKVLLCSRPEVDINQALKGVSTIKVEGRNNRDIEQNVTTLLQNMPRWTPTERALAVSEIVRKAGGEFRYVELAVNFMRLSAQNLIQDRLKHLPEDLMHSYSQALCQTDPAYLELLKTAATWVLLADGDITGMEIMDAFSRVYGEEQEEEGLQSVVDADLFIEQILKAGSVFFEIDRTSMVVKPQHAAANDYFLKPTIMITTATAASISSASTEDLTPDSTHLCARCQSAPRHGQEPFTVSEKGANGINERDTKFFRTPLHAACSGDHYGVLQALLAHGALLDNRDKYGHTPLVDCYMSFAKSSSNDFEAVLLVLIDKDQNTATCDSELLRIAAMKGSIPLLTRLLDIGADPTVVDEHSWSSVQLARQYGHSEAAELLAGRSRIAVRKPFAWLRHSVFPFVGQRDDTFVEYVSRGTFYQATISNSPIPAGVKKYYYEVEITSSTGQSRHLAISIGFCHKPDELIDWLPGDINFYSRHSVSWGYHGDGALLNSVVKDSALDAVMPTYGHGDIIGCGVEFATRTIFYTRNGVRLATAFQYVTGRLHPAIGMGQPASMRANFGNDLLARPFKWKEANGGEWSGFGEERFM